MKPLRSLLHLLGVVVFASASTLHAQIIDLLHDSTSPVLTSGSYTYYARGQWNGSANVDIASFTTKFYPGYSATAAYNHTGTSTSISQNEGYSTTIQDTGSAVAIPVTGNIPGYTSSRGKLTDGSTNTSVGGWQGVVSSTGTFDILIDLGAIYDITTVSISYTDSSGRRWTTTTGAQAVYTATTLSSTPVDSDFTLLANGTFVRDASKGTVDFTGSSSVMARYIDLRLSTGALTYGGTSYGGTINEIYVMGTVPEPSSVALVAAGTLCLIFSVARRHRGTAV